MSFAEVTITECYACWKRIKSSKDKKKCIHYDNCPDTGITCVYNNDIEIEDRIKIFKTDLDSGLKSPFDKNEKKISKLILKMLVSRGVIDEL